MSLLTNSFIAKYAPSLVIGIKDVVAALLQASELTEWWQGLKPEWRPDWYLVRARRSQGIYEQDIFELNNGKDLVMLLRKF